MVRLTERRDHGIEPETSQVDEKEHSMFDPNNQYPQSNPYDTSNQYNPNYFKDQDFQAAQGNRSPRPRQRRVSNCLGCLLSLALMFGIFFLIFKISTSWHLPDSPFFYSQGDNPFTVSQLWIIGVSIWMIGAISLFIFRISRGNRSNGSERPMRQLAISMFGLTFVALFITAFIWSSIFNPNIGMTQNNFMRVQVGINNGATIHFSNFANGVTQILCIGVDQHCQSANGAPGEFEHGLVIQPGQTVDIVFDTDGTYQITSKTTPHMNATIDVTTPDDSGGD